MRVPRQLLRDEIEVRDFAGSGARGPQFGEPRTMRASVQPTTRLEVDASGEQVNVTSLVIVRPEDGPVRPESRVTSRGVQYRVVRCYPVPDERRPMQYEMTLSQLSPASAGGGGS